MSDTPEKAGELIATVQITGDADTLLEAVRRLRNPRVVRSVSLTAYIPDGMPRRPTEYQLGVVTSSDASAAMGAVETFTRRVTFEVAERYRKLILAYKAALGRR